MADRGQERSAPLGITDVKRRPLAVGIIWCNAWAVLERPDRSVGRDSAERYRASCGQTPITRALASGAHGGHSAIVSVEEAERAIEICEGNQNAFFAGPRGELIDAAETELGFAFPPSYRLFVDRLGAGSIGAFEVYGLTRAPFSGPIPDAVWVTLRDRRGPSRLPDTLIVIGSDGMGGDYVLDVSKGDEPPVEVWEGGSSVEGGELERVADSFGSFLLGNVQRESGK